MALREALKRLRLTLTQSKPILNQRRCAGVQSIESCDQMRRQPEPAACRFEQRQKRIDGAQLGQDRILVRATPLPQGDSLVDLEGDATIKPRLELTPGLRVETIEHVRDNLDAEVRRLGEGLLGEASHRSVAVVGDSGQSGSQDDLTDASSQKVGSSKSGLNRLQSPHRWRLWKLIDRSSKLHALEMHGGKQKRVKDLLVVGSLQRLKSFHRTARLGNRMGSFDHRPSLKQNLIGIGLIEDGEVNPVGSKLSHDERASFSQNSSGGDRASADSTGDLTGLEAAPDTREHELAFTIIDQSTRTSDRTAFSTMSPNELPDGFMRTTGPSAELTSRLVG